MNAGYMAELARLELTDAERDHLGGQVNAILGFVEQLKRVDVSGVEPMAHAVRQVNVSRADEIRPSLPREEALRNGPVTMDGLFVVPKIVE